MPHSKALPPEHKATANPKFTTVVINLYHSTYLRRSDSPTTDSKSPSSFAIAILYDGMMMNI